MKRSITVAVALAELLWSQSPLDAEPGRGFDGECARASQVYASLDFRTLFSAKEYKGFQFVTRGASDDYGRPTCFEVGYFDLQRIAVDQKSVRFAYVSKHLSGAPDGMQCNTNYSIRWNGKTEKESVSRGEITIFKENLDYKNGYCSVYLALQFGGDPAGPMRRHFGPGGTTSSWYQEKGVIRDVSFNDFRLESWN